MAWYLIKHLESHIYCPYLWKYVTQEVLTNAEVYLVERKLGCSLLYFDFRLPNNRLRNSPLRIKNKIIIPTTGGSG